MLAILKTPKGALMKTMILIILNFISVNIFACPVETNSYQVCPQDLVYVDNGNTEIHVDKQKYKPLGIILSITNKTAIVEDSWPFDLSNRQRLTESIADLYLTRNCIDGKCEGDLITLENRYPFGGYVAGVNPYNRKLAINYTYEKSKDPITDFIEASSVTITEKNPEYSENFRKRSYLIQNQNNTFSGKSNYGLSKAAILSSIITGVDYKINLKKSAIANGRSKCLQTYDNCEVDHDSFDLIEENQLTYGIIIVKGS